MDSGTVHPAQDAVLSALSVSFYTHPHLCFWPKDALTLGQFRSVIQPERGEQKGHGKENYTNGYKRK